MNKRNLCLVAFIATVSLIPNLVSAQAGLCGVADVQACLDACAAYGAGLPDDDESTEDELIAHCTTLPACTTVSMTAARLRSARSLCHGVFHDRTTPVVAPSTERRTPPAFCILPDGSVTTDEGRRRCGCPAGTYPIQASPHRSSDRLRSLEVPRGHNVFVCYSPLAPRGAPGSADERREALASTVGAHDDALRALCAPDEGETLAAACAEARTAFLAARSTAGPVDLAPVRRVIAAASARTLRAAREAAETTGREAGRDAGREAAREVVARAGSSRSENFAMLQAYGIVSFSPLRYANADYGVPFGIGAELSVGIGLGGGWNVHGGIALGYGGPDLPGVTNVQGAWHVGFGAWVDPGVMIGFGILGTHRFRPDVFSVHSVYGPYLDATFRFFPRAEWTPVATIRGFAGASPYLDGAVWQVGADGGFMALIGIAHL